MAHRYNYNQHLCENFPLPHGSAVNKGQKTTAEIHTCRKDKTQCEKLDTC